MHALSFQLALCLEESNYDNFNLDLSKQVDSNPSGN